MLETTITPQVDKAKGQEASAHASSKLDQTSLNLSPVQYVWWCVRTLMTQDIGYVLSHRPEASGDASYHLTGNTFRSL